MRRQKGVIIKRTVGALESPLFVYFLGEQKIDTRAVAELQNHVKYFATKSHMLTRRAIRESPLIYRQKHNAPTEMVGATLVLNVTQPLK